MSTKKKYVRSRFKPYKLYLPENLDIDNLLEEYPPEFKNLPKNYKIYRDKFVYILHLINSIPNSINDFDYEANLGFTPIHKENLRNLIHDYRSYIDYMVGMNIVIEDTYFKKGEKSGGLKFNDEFIVKVKPVKITCNSLIKGIVKSKRKRDINKERKLSFLLDWFNDDLNVDFENASTYITNDIPNSKKRAELKRERKKYPKSIQQILPSIDRIVQLGNISKFNTLTIIKEKDYSHKLKFDLTTGRFHTPLTRLKKELRPFINYRNEKLVNVDIINSQPLLSLIILELDIFMRLRIKDLISKYNPSYNDIEISHKDIIYSPIYTKLVNLIQSGANKSDVIEYKKAVIEGRYYESFGQILVDKGLIPEDINSITDVIVRKNAIRKYAKTATFQAFFDRRSAARYNPIVRAFKSCYPNVYKIFQQVKLGSRTVLNKKGKPEEKSTYNTLACILQRFESFLVLDKTCLEIHSTDPNIPLYTIHDSIITTESNFDKVNEIFSKNIYELLGIKPKLQKEVW